MPHGSPWPDLEKSGVGTSGGTEIAEETDPLTVAGAGPRFILLTGGDGFLGRHLLPRLVARGHRVRALVRPGRQSRAVGGDGVEWWRADARDPAALSGVAAGCDRVVHLAEPHYGRPAEELEPAAAGTAHILAEARVSGVKRVVYASCAGVEGCEGPFFDLKRRGERSVRESGIEPVILRPAVTHGPGDHFVTPMARLLRSLPVFPMFGDGRFPLRPVAVEDVVDALCQAVERPDVGGQTLDLFGPVSLTFVRAVLLVAQVLGRRRPILRLPRMLAPILALCADLGLPAPPLPWQMERLRGVGTCNACESPLRSVFRVKPLPFGETLADYL